MGATPLFSDGEYIYSLSMNVKREDDESQPQYPRLTVEGFAVT